MTNLTNLTTGQPVLREGIVDALTAVTVAISGFLAFLVFAA
jgi:hypothetical protein